MKGVRHTNPNERFHFRESMGDRPPFSAQDRRRGLGMPRDDVRTTSASHLFRLDRQAAYTTHENLVWRKHIQRETLGSANLLANRLLTPDPDDLSYLRSASGNSAGWEAAGLRRDQFALTLERLESGGSMRGSLQLSHRSLPYADGGDGDDDDDDELPPDFVSSRRTPFATSPWSSSILSASASRLPTSAYPTANGWGTREMPSLGMDVRRPRPPPLISNGGGVRSSLNLSKTGVWSQCRT